MSEPAPDIAAAPVRHLEIKAALLLNQRDVLSGENLLRHFREPEREEENDYDYDDDED